MIKTNLAHHLCLHRHLGIIIIVLLFGSHTAFSQEIASNSSFPILHENDEDEHLISNDEASDVKAQPTCSISFVTPPPVTFTHCNPTPQGNCNASDCANCTTFALLLDCDDCCVTGVTFDGDKDSDCFSLCAKIIGPTATPWIADGGRDLECSVNGAVLSGSGSGGATWCDGGTLVFRLCGAAGTKVKFTITFNCGAADISSSVTL